MGGVKINGRFHLSVEEEFFNPSLSSSSGSLVTRGVQCEQERRPLCHRLGASFSLSRLEKQLDSCAGGGETWDPGTVDVDSH